jgi:hypothetical protein
MGLCAHSEGVIPFSLFDRVNNVQPLTITIRIEIDNINVTITN